MPAIINLLYMSIYNPKDQQFKEMFFLGKSSSSIFENITWKEGNVLFNNVLYPSPSHFTQVGAIAYVC